MILVTRLPRNTVVDRGSKNTLSPSLILEIRSSRKLNEKRKPIKPSLRNTNTG